MIIYRAKVPKTPPPTLSKQRCAKLQEFQLVLDNWQRPQWQRGQSCWIMLWGNHEFHDLKPALFVIRSSRIICHSCIRGKSRRQWIVDITIKSTIKAHLASKRQRRLFISCFHQQTGPARSELLQGPVSLGALIGADRRDDLRVTHAKTWCNQLNKRNLAIIWQLY